MLDERFDASPYAAASSTSSFRRIEPTEMQLAVYDAPAPNSSATVPSGSTTRTSPSRAQAIARPEEIDSTESLYLAGLHLEQYRHATRQPEDYFREALLRIRATSAAIWRWVERFIAAANTAQRNRFSSARWSVRRATIRTRPTANATTIWVCAGRPRTNSTRQKTHSTSPLGTPRARTRPIFNWHGSLCAGAIGRSGRVTPALPGTQRPASSGHASAGSRARRTRQTCEAPRIGRTRIAARSVQFRRAVREKRCDSMAIGATVDRRMRDSSHNYLELAIDYAAAGCYERSIAVLSTYLDRVAETTGHATRLLLLGRVRRRTGRYAARPFAVSKLGAKLQRQGFFPNRREDLAVLQSAVARLPGDFRAWCDIGNLLYSKRRYDEAIRAWEDGPRSGRRFRPAAPQSWAWHISISTPTRQSAWKSLEQAFQLNPDDARVLYELDQLAKRLESRRGRATGPSASASELRSPPRRPDDRTNHAVESTRPT